MWRIRKVSFTTDLGVRSKLAPLPSPTAVEADWEISSSTMLTIFGGRIDDLKSMLLEERFSENWEPRVRSYFGLTMVAFNGTVLPVERGVDTKAYLESLRAKDAS